MTLNRRPNFLIGVLVIALLNLMLVSAAGAALNKKIAGTDGELISINISPCFSDMKEMKHTFQHEKQDCQSEAATDICSTCAHFQAALPAVVFNFTVKPESSQAGQSEKLFTFFSPPIQRPPITFLV